MNKRRRNQRRLAYSGGPLFTGAGQRTYGVRVPPQIYWADVDPQPSTAQQSRFEPYYLIPPTQSRDINGRYYSAPRQHFRNNHPADDETLPLDGPQVELHVNETLTTFDKQASDLLNQLQLTPHRKRQIDLVLQDVIAVWQKLIYDVRPIIYGSLGNGLATRYSDIDCFIASNVIPDNVERIKMMLSYHSKMYQGGRFRDVVPVRKARVPIIKAVHVRTGIPIDISCTADSALRNTELINHLVTSDPRVRPLTLLVLTFYRKRALAGTSKFVSYVITLFVVFYLQLVRPPILPPLWKIMSLPSYNPTLDTCMHLPYLNGSAGDHVDPALNQMTLLELFRGFFEFYCETDFENVVISPYLGALLSPKLFENLEHLPNEFAVIKQYYSKHKEERIPLLQHSLRLQDPIRLDTTPATSVHKNTLELFINENNRFLEEVLKKRQPSQWLPTMFRLPPVRLQPKKKLPSGKTLKFTVGYSMEENWLPDLISSLFTLFDLLLFEAKLVRSQEKANDEPSAVFEVCSYFDVFKARFKNRILDVIEQPESLPSIKEFLITTSSNMKKPESSFCARIDIIFSTNSKHLNFLLTDTNENVRNTFQHVSPLLETHLGKMLSAVKKYRETHGDKQNST